MMQDLRSATTLSNGVKMPWLGLGVFKVQEGDEVINAVKAALELGYHHIDTAAIYRNEEGVGLAIKESNIPREELFVTTKVWNKAQGYESTLAAFEKSRAKLGLDYIDLYLIHWPVNGMYVETWKALEQLYREDKVKAIGVSNFHIHHLQDILESCHVKPMVNQVEYHPYLSQRELKLFCQEHHIQLEAWSPLMQGKILDDPILISLAEKYGKTVAQIVLRWNLQNEVVTIPKSIRPERIKENADVFNFELSLEDMELIHDLNKNERIGPDPDNFDF